MEISNTHNKKFVVNLPENQFIDWLNEIVEARNSNLRNVYFLRIMAPSGAGELITNLEPRWNPSKNKHVGTCRCGHHASSHWDINNDYKECKSCECEGFYE
jgi:hypothetical protein